MAAAIPLTTINHGVTITLANIFRVYRNQIYILYEYFYESGESNQKAIGYRRLRYKGESERNLLNLTELRTSTRKRKQSIRALTFLCCI